MQFVVFQTNTSAKLAFLSFFYDYLATLNLRWKKTSEAEKNLKRRKKNTPEAEKTSKGGKKSFRISANFRVISMIGKKAVLYTTAALNSTGLKTANCE